MTERPRRELSILRGELLQEGLFSLIAWAKTNNRMMQKSFRMLRGIRSSPFMTSKAVKEDQSNRRRTT